MQHVFTYAHDFHDPALEPTVFKWIVVDSCTMPLFLGVLYLFAVSNGAILFELTERSFVILINNEVHNYLYM